MEQDPLKPSPHLLCKLGSVIEPSPVNKIQIGYDF